MSADVEIDTGRERSLSTMLGLTANAAPDPLRKQP